MRIVEASGEWIACTTRDCHEWSPRRLCTSRIISLYERKKCDSAKASSFASCCTSCSTDTFECRAAVAMPARPLGAAAGACKPCAARPDFSDLACISLARGGGPGGASLGEGAKLTARGSSSLSGE